MKRKQMNKLSQPSFLLDVVLVFFGALSLYTGGLYLYWSYATPRSLDPPQLIFSPQLIWWTPIIVVVVASIILQLMQLKEKKFWRSTLIGTGVSLFLGATYIYFLFVSDPNIRELFSGSYSQILITQTTAAFSWFPFIFFQFASSYGIGYFAVNYVAARIRHSLVGSRLQK